MFRTTAVVVLLLGLVLATGSRAEDDRTLELGKKYEGEISGETKLFLNIFAHQANLKVKLKAGQAVSIQGKVLGDGRKIGLILRDKTGKQVASAALAPESNILKMKQTPSSGEYTVVVASDQVGAFTVVASVEEELSENDLEKKIEALEQELAYLKAKLMAIRSKK
jgi:hypothetical protein